MLSLSSGLKTLHLFFRSSTEFTVLKNVNNFLHTSISNHSWNVYHLCKPSPLYHKFRRKIYFPEKYTVEPLRNDNLGGRDPNTGIYNITLLLKCVKL